MELLPKQIQGLLRLIGLTQDVEINCDQCLSQVSEFTESKLAGKTIPEALQAVEQHLSVCVECHEEYEALQKALGDLDEPAAE